MTNFQLKSLLGVLAGLDMITLAEAEALHKKLGREQVPPSIAKIAAQVASTRASLREEAS